MKVKNYIYSRYSGINSILLLRKDRTIREEYVKTKFYEQCKLPARYWKSLKADRFFPSSKMCSCCKTIKRDLKLKDRTYICSKKDCNLVIDRDKNSSINLANYQLV